MAVKDGLGPRPVAQSAKRYFLDRQETEVQSKLESKDPVAGLKHHGSEGRACVVLQLAFVLHGSGQGTPSQGSNTMAVKDGAGPRPVAQSAKRYFLNRQETEVQTVTLPATAAVQAVESKDPVAGLKHHGSEGRACVVLQLAFVLHGSGQGTPSQGSNTMAVTDGLGPRPVAQSAKRYSLNRQETEVQTVTSKDPVAGLKHHGSEGRIGPAARSPECQTQSAKRYFLNRQETEVQTVNSANSKDPVAGLKHHGSEGRIGPAARSPECQTLLSEPTRN